MWYKKNVKTGVEYSTDSIVSKQLLNKASGTLTLFAFDKGQSLSAHTAPFDAIAQVTEGMGGFIVGEEQLSLSAGDIVIMPAHVPHAIKAPERFKMLLTMMKSEP